MRHTGEIKLGKARRIAGGGGNRGIIAQKIPPVIKRGAFLSKISPGDDLLSHDLNTAVSSAMKGLTSGFGMEPGVPPSLWTPTNSNPLRIWSRRERIRGSG